MIATSKRDHPPSGGLQEPPPITSISSWLIERPFLNGTFLQAQTADKSCGKEQESEDLAQETALRVLALMGVFISRNLNILYFKDFTVAKSVSISASRISFIPSSQRIELGNMPQRVQELALLNDVLFVAVVR